MRYLTLLACLMFCFTVQAQFEDVTITTTQVNGAVYMMEGRGGNPGSKSGHRVAGSAKVDARPKGA